MEFTNDFGDIDEKFYTSIENAYETSLKLMDKEGVLSKFQDRASDIVEETQDIGWGFHDYLAEVYYKHFE